jgi:hypothetical protein
MEKKRLSDIRITEIYMIKADWRRTFLAEIQREVDENGNPVVRGKVCIIEGQVWGAGTSEEEFGKNLDDICLFKLDYGLHKDAGITFEIAGQAFFLN